MTFKVRSISWLGVRTDKFLEMRHLFKDVFGLEVTDDTEGFCAFDTTEGDTIEVFGSNHPHNPHFLTGPVAGFLVDDIEQAKQEMEASGIEFIGDIDGSPESSLWAHFKGPDGNLYELKWRAKKAG